MHLLPGRVLLLIVAAFILLQLAAMVMRLL